MENMYTVAMRMPFNEAVRLTKESLAAHGFGILSDSDLAAQLGTDAPAELGDYRILGACDTSLMGEALALDPAAGTILPCNVVVRQERNDPVTVVEAMSPQTLFGRAAEQQLQDVATQTSRGLEAAMSTLRASAGPA